MSRKTLFALPYILIVCECLANTVGFSNIFLKKDEGLCLFFYWKNQGFTNSHTRNCQQKQILTVVSLWPNQRFNCVNSFCFVFFFLSCLFLAHIKFTNLPQNVTNAFEVSFPRCYSSYASLWREGTIVLPLITATVFRSIFKWKQFKGIKRINQASLIPYKTSVTPHI